MAETKVKVYYAKEKSIQKWLDKGWALLPDFLTNGETILYKDIHIAKESELVSILTNIYTGYNWQKHAFYLENDDTKEIQQKRAQALSYFKDIGLVFEPAQSYKGYNLKIDSMAMDTLCSWRLEILMEEKEDYLLRLTPFDYFFPNPLYPAKWIYPYAKNIIKDLIESNLLGAKYFKTEQ